MVTISRFRNIDWLAAVLYPLAVILMEVFWVSPWLSWFGSLSFFSEARPVLHLPSVLIIIVVSILITRIFIRQRLPLWASQVIIIGGGLVTMLLVLGVEYSDGYTFLSGQWFGHVYSVLGNTFSNPGTIAVAIPIIIYLWWRGIMLGQSTSYFRNIYRSFLLGMGALVILIIFWKISEASNKIPGLGSEIGVNIMAFFFFGLLAIAISHLYNMRSTMSKEEARLTSVWRWVPVMLGVIGGMIIIGFAVASIISPDFIDAIGNGTRAFLSFLGTVLGYIVTPIVYIGQGLVWLFRWFISLFAQSETAELPGMENLAPLEFQEGISAEIPPIVTEVIKWVVLAVIVGVIIFFLARAISRYRDRCEREEIEEVHESLGSWRAFKDDLALLFKSLGNRFKKKPAAPTPLVFDADATGPLDIREIFRHLQWEGARSGIPRRRHETATEYAKHIKHVIPDSRLQLNDLTGMYENVRYGEETAPADKLDKANNLWQTLKGLLRKLRGD